MSKLRIGGWSPRNINPLSQDEKAGLTIPQILSISTNPRLPIPDAETINRLIKEKTKINSFIVALSKNKIINFRGSGKLVLEDKQHIKRYTSRVFSLRGNYIIKELSLKQDLNEIKIPSFGSYLYGDLTTKGKLYNIYNKEVSLASLNNNLTEIPKFNITYLNHSDFNKKGCIMTMDSIELKILQSYTVKKRTTEKPNIRENIKISKNRIVIDNNSSITQSRKNEILNVLEGKIPQVNETTKTVFFDYDEESETFQLRDKLPLLNLDKQDFTNLFESYISRDRFISEKIFGNIVQDLNLDGGNAYLTLSPVYTLNQINLLFFMILYELKIDLFNEVEYFIYENLLNKVFYAIKNEDISFDEKNILKNPKIYNFISNPKNDNYYKSQFIKNKFINRRSHLGYYEYKDKLTQEEYNKIPVEIREIYKQINTDAVKEILTKIYYMSTYIKNITNDVFIAYPLENELEIVVNRKIFDL